MENSLFFARTEKNTALIFLQNFRVGALREDHKKRALFSFRSLVQERREVALSKKKNCLYDAIAFVLQCVFVMSKEYSNKRAPFDVARAGTPFSSKYKRFLGALG